MNSILSKIQELIFFSYVFPKFWLSEAINNKFFKFVAIKIGWLSQIVELCSKVYRFLIGISKIERY